MKNKILSKLSGFKFRVSREKINRVTGLFKRIFASRGVRVFFVFLFLIIAIAEFVFGVMIYGFKMDNKATAYASKIVPYPSATANYEVITYNKYKKEKDYIHHFYAATQQSDLDYSSIDREILNQLIENRLISAQALRNGIKVTKEDVDASVEQIIVQNGGEQKVNKALDDLYGLSLDEFKKLVKTQMLREKVSQELIARVTASHILIRVDKDAPQEKIDEARAKIDGIKKEVDGGLDFAEAAKKYSEDVGSAEQGGKLDPFSKGEMVEEFSNMAFSTPVGQISEPVKTEFGWHIIKVDEKKGKVDTSFNDWLTGLKERSLIFKFI